jgi:UDP-3-O-[3-hydroxymyristoyl] glucosamine N-acyltransferase
MRFQGGFAPADVVRACGPLLLEPPPAALPALFAALDAPRFSEPQSLVVVGQGARLADLENLKAAWVLAEEGAAGWPTSIPMSRIAGARRVVAALIQALAPRMDRKAPFAAGNGNTVAASATVEGVLEGGVEVGAGAHVAAGSFIGRGTRLDPRAVVMPHVRIGRNCVIQSGAVIGCEGFGFFDAGRDLEPMPHWAGLEIGDDCFVGANAVIAAGVLHPTVIGNGSKLDSHVQIAHNVRLGQGCLLASQSGVAGSTEIGDGFRMGGAASVAGHLRIGKNVSVAACSGVTKDWADGSVVAGFPAIPIREWRRREAMRRGSGQARRLAGPEFPG